MLNLNDFEPVSNGKTQLGSGSFASVTLVKEKSTGMLYALKKVMIYSTLSLYLFIHSILIGLFCYYKTKKIFQSKQIDLEFSKNLKIEMENLKREVSNHKKMNHPNIIKFYDYFQGNKKFYILLEYAPNGNLFHYMAKKGRLDEKTAIKFFVQTCKAVDYIHKQNVLHRDLKPENLLLSKDMNIKMCDFGWCAEYDQENKRKTFCGTYEYMAPEIFQKKLYGVSIDIWSLGILLYELFHGKSPFRGKNLSEIYSNIISGRIVYTEKIPHDAKLLINKILRIDPNERPSIDSILSHPLITKYFPEFDIPMPPTINYNSENFASGKHRRYLSECNGTFQIQKPTPEINKEGFKKENIPLYVRNLELADEPLQMTKGYKDVDLPTKPNNHNVISKYGLCLNFT